jgi:tetratricopeptide (TPR) repeat protein
MDLEYLEAHIKEAHENEDHLSCIEFCKELIEIDKKNTLGHDYLAISFLKAGYYKEAINIYSKIIEDGSQDFSHYVFRGDCFYNLRLFNRALPDFIESLKIDPKAGASWQRVAEAYFMMGDFEKAHLNIDRAIQLGDYHRDPWTIKAIFYKIEGKLEESYKLFSEIRKKYPNDRFLISQQFEILYNSINNNIDLGSKKGYFHKHKKNLKV